METSCRFFIPSVPSEDSQYKEGINGKKIIVVGDSFYCNKDYNLQCKNWERCTNVEYKDSSVCSDNKDCYYFPLRNRPSSDDAPLYDRFGELMSMFCPNLDMYSIWKKLPFTNYIQFVLPRSKTEKKYVTGRDFKAFLETLDEYQPDIVIIWGSNFNEEIRKESGFTIECEEEIAQNDYYLFHWRYKGRIITFVNCVHPSSRCCAWERGIAFFRKYLNIALAENI